MTSDGHQNGLHTCGISTLCMWFVIVSAGCQKTAPPSTATAPHCAQYCIHFVCQLTGVPVTMDQVVGLLPAKPGGESLLAIKRTLEAIGFHVTARRVDVGRLAAGPFPAIVAVPNHLNKAGQPSISVAGRGFAAGRAAADAGAGPRPR